jgi:uncharacterized protein YbjT (DUF2867 family)
VPHARAGGRRPGVRHGLNDPAATRVQLSGPAAFSYAEAADIIAKAVGHQIRVIEVSFEAFVRAAAASGAWS